MAISLLFGFLIFYFAAISTATAGKFFFHSFFLPYLIFHSVPKTLCLYNHVQVESVPLGTVIMKLEKNVQL